MNWFKEKTLGLFVKTNGLLSKPLFSGLGHIFMLHRVLPESQRNFCTINKDLAITPDHLEFCIDYFLQRDYEFISLDELYIILQHQKRPTNKFVCLTFDDGYLDNLNYAYPLLKARDIPFTIYITNSFPNRTGILWWYWLEKYMMKTNTLSLKRGNKTHSFSWINFEETHEKFHQIRREILSMTHQEFKQFCQLELQLKDADIQDECHQETMSWKDLKALSKDPLVTIGSHTMNHLPLAAQLPEVLHFEMQQSKTELEQNLMMDVDHFAYPYGSFLEAGHREYNAAKETGFKTATINFPGNIFYGSTESIMFLPRMPLGNVTTKEKLDYISNGITHFSYNGFSKIPVLAND